MAKRAAKTTDENDFNALDKLARRITFEKLRPLSAEQQRRWDRAKSSGPKQNAASRSAVATVVLLDPKLVARVDAYARRAGISRSQVFDRSLRKALSQSK